MSDGRHDRVTSSKRSAIAGFLAGAVLCFSGMTMARHRPPGTTATGPLASGKGAVTTTTVHSSSVPTKLQPSTAPTAVPRPELLNTAMITTTPGIGERIDVASNGDLITAASSPKNDFGNIREVFWRPDVRESTNQQVCMDWLTPDGRAQPGIALRISPPTADQPLRTIVVDQNIWAGVLWRVHVLLFKGTRTGDLSNMTAAGSAELADTTYETIRFPDGTHTQIVRPGPWHVCARVTGRMVQFKLWVRDAPEPSWADAKAVQQVELPPDWVRPGYPGGYVAHVRSGNAFLFASLTTRELEAEN